MMENQPSDDFREPNSKSENAIIGFIAFGVGVLAPSVYMDQIPDNTTVVAWTIAVAIAFGNALADKS